MTADRPSVGHYSIERELGRGGMGVAYLATDSRLQRLVAIKSLPQRMARNPHYMARFRREARTLASLNHPCIAILHALEESADGSCHLVMEYIEGETLRDRLDRGAISVAEAMSLCAQIADGLSAAHSRSIVHRDIKPANVMVRPDGRVKILDFGLAKTAGDNEVMEHTYAPDDPSLEDPSSPTVMLAQDFLAIGSTEVGAILGTPGYLSPEQARATPVDSRSDVFSFGCVLYECLTGRRAFAGDSVHDLLLAVLGAEPDLQSLPTDTSDSVVELLVHCFAKDLDQRLADIGEAAVVLGAEPPPASSLHADAISHSLPGELSTFVGREKVLAEIQERLGSARLLTLTGAGGCGKTRLALRVTQECLHGELDGVWFLDLAPLQADDRIGELLLRSFGLPEPSRSEAEGHILEHLRGRRFLIVVDNCEHVLAATARLVQSILGACEGGRFLVTSRELLGVAGEVVYRVPSMAVPDPEDGATAAAALASEAVTLFLERAQAAGHSFEITDQNCASVTEICRRVEGIPLAIELAAARTRVLSPAQIATKLESSFRILSGGSHLGLERHRTLQATIEWSYDMLSQAEKHLLERLGVFAGGCALDAAEAVCPDEGSDLDSWDVLDLLSNLVDKSLVAVEPGCGGTPRYDLLESVREFALEKCGDDRGELAACRRRMLRYFADWSSRVDQRLELTDQGEELDRIEREVENVFAALEWCQVEGDSDSALVGLELATGLGALWSGRGYFQVPIGILTALLHRTGETAEYRLRVRACNVIGTLLGNVSREAEGMEFHRRALELAELCADRGLVASSWGALATSHRRQGNWQEARMCFGKQLEILEELGDRRLVASCLGGIGTTYRHTGDYDRARELGERALAVARELGALSAIGNQLGNLGVLARLQGDLDRARALHEESLDIARSGGSKPQIMLALGRLGNIVAQQCDHEVARDCYEQSAALATEMGDRYTVAASYGNLGALAATRGEWPESARWMRQAFLIALEIFNRPLLLELLGLVLPRAPSAEAERWFDAMLVHREYTRAGHIERIAASLGRDLGSSAGPESAELKPIVGEVIAWLRSESGGEKPGRIHG